jgi:hypothetical protein
MSVSRCVCGCNRQIYVSSIPGGGAPVSMPNAAAYATAALQCHGCGRYICKPCSESRRGLSPMGSCPSCGGNLAFPGVEPPGGFPLAPVALDAAGRPVAARRPAGPPTYSNTIGTISLVLGVLGMLCCVGSLNPIAGCMGLLVDFAAILTGSLGVLKARNTGVGMIPSGIGLALGVINLLVTIVATIGFFFYQYYG